jgi:catechol 2,3-dioxygenase-like lactoylglutathione lyase family enzyme
MRLDKGDCRHAGPSHGKNQERSMIDDHSHIRGLHHVTAIASGAQANVDFYTRVLGLRLVKRTVNFDAPDTYHFYYGDGAGSPGSLLTFFPFENVGKTDLRGPLPPV